MNETLKALFESAGLPTDFPAKAQVVFEAAVNQAVEAKLVSEVTKIQEAAEAKLAESQASWVADQDAMMEAFMDATVLQWANENKVALDTNIKSELVESVLSSFKVALGSAGITVPEAQVAILESTEAKLTASTAQETALAAQLAEVTANLLTYQKAEIIAEATDELTDVASERVATLAENIAFKDLASFKASVLLMAEAFGAKPKADDKDGDDKGDDKGVDGADDEAKAKAVKEAADKAEADKEKTPVVESTEFDVVASSAKFIASGRR